MLQLPSEQADDRLEEQDSPAIHTSEDIKPPTDLKAPSFKGFTPASEVSSRTKSRNRRRDTAHELLLRRELWRLGLRYRVNVESLLGKPDLVFPGARVVLFCDGDFWHGRDWEELKAKLAHRANAEYWIAKIGANVARDARITANWEESGWHVIRLWETDIKRDPAAIACHVRDIVVSRRRSRE